MQEFPNHLLLLEDIWRRRYIF